MKKRNIKEGALSSFKLEKFGNLPTVKEKFQYAIDNLEYIDTGTTRSVFRMKAGKVLKLAGGAIDKNTEFPRGYRSNYKFSPKQPAHFQGGDTYIQNGIEQNKKELTKFMNMKKSFSDSELPITKVINWAPDASWLVSETARPLSLKEFEADLGTSQFNLFDMLDTYEQQKTLNVPPRLKNNPLIQKIIQLTNAGIQDLANYKQWGKTADGRTVVLDYGINEEVPQQS